MMQCQSDMAATASKGGTLQLTCGANVGSASADLLVTPCSTDALFCNTVRLRKVLRRDGLHLAIHGVVH